MNPHSRHVMAICAELSHFQLEPKQSGIEVCLVYERKIHHARSLDLCDRRKRKFHGSIISYRHLPRNVERPAPVMRCGKPLL